MTGVYSKELNTIQNAFSAFARALSDFSKNTEQIKANYNAVALDTAIKEQQEDFNNIKASEKTRITNATDELKAHISQLWTPNPTLYNKDVVAMLNDGLLTYTANDIENIATERFSDNPTMLQVLRGYAEKHDLIKQLKQDSILLFASKQKKLDTVEAFKQELFSVIDSADESDGHVTAVSYAANNFESVFKNKLDVIGEI